MYAFPDSSPEKVIVKLFSSIYVISAMPACPVDKTIDTDGNLFKLCCIIQGLAAVFCTNT
jgi:hypothetical protein